MSIRFVRISRASWIKVITTQGIFHIDPGYTGYPQNQGLPTEELVEKAQAILVSHFHKDHLQPEAVKWLRNENTVIVAPSSCVPRIGGSVTIVQPGDKIAIGETAVEAVHAYNTADSHSTRKVHRRGAFVGYVITILGKRIYHAGDTDLIPEMEDLGRIDVAFLPIGGTFVMDAEEAARATAIIQPRTVIPIHQGKADVSTFAALVESHTSSRVKPLDPGEALEITS